MAGRQIQGQGGRRERLLTPHDLAGIVTAQQGFVSGPVDYNSLINKPILATVATSGSYTDLSGKPTAFPPNGPAGGSLTGTYPNPGVIVPVSSVFGRTGAVVAATNDYSFNQINGLIIPQGYIDGLQMVWNSATSISVTSGTAYVPSLGNVLQSNVMLTLSGLVLTASTWYHVYLYSNAGTPAIECVTTAPVLYYGTAYQKTGDNARRYMGSVATDASGNLFSFVQTQSKIIYRSTGGGVVPFRFVNNITNTTLATASPSATVPITAICFVGYVQNLSSNAFFAINAPSDAQFNFYIGPGKTFIIDIYTEGSQVQYKFDVAPSGGGGYIDVMGYYYER